MYRFCHHRSNTDDDLIAGQPYFWYQPVASVSMDGRWAAFTSNWEKTLGASPPSETGYYRQDAFIVKLN